MIIERGELADEMLVVTSGWAARYIALADGRNQIVNFTLPGDIFDLQAFFSHNADHSIAAITQVSMVSIPSLDIIDVFSEPNNVGLALWWATLQEEALLREQIVRK